MKWIGLTGGLGSGKSTVTGFLRQRGYPVVDADEIARFVVEPGTPGLRSVAAEFGADLVRPDGSLDRALLASRVFGHPERLLKLESLLHPLVQQETTRRRGDLTKAGFQIAFYDVPLLYEKKIEGFDAVVVVVTTLPLQRQRLRQRNANWSEDEIDRRLKSQLPMEQKEKLAHHVLRNDGDLAHLEKQVDELMKKLAKVSN